MRNRILQLVALVPLTAPLPAGAILLDCEVNADRVYTCIEISDAATHTAAPEGTETYSAEYSAYIEEAKKSCVYREPRRRVSGKNTSAALRVEELKSARADYEQCIADKARAMWRSNNAGGKANAPSQRTGPTGEQ